LAKKKCDGRATGFCAVSVLARFEMSMTDGSKAAQQFRQQHLVTAEHKDKRPIDSAVFP
jgi:hypothetical protein